METKKITYNGALITLPSVEDVRGKKAEVIDVIARSIGAQLRRRKEDPDDPDYGEFHNPGVPVEIDLKKL